MQQTSGRDLSPWRRAELIERAANGENRTALAKEYGLDRSTVKRWVARFAKEACVRQRKRCVPTR